MTISPDFTQLSHQSAAAAGGYGEWKAALMQKTGKRAEDYVRDSLEKIPIQPIYTEDDVKGMEHLQYQAGMAPFLRGPYATMYVFRP